MTDLAKLVVRLEAQTAQYQAQLEKAERKLTSFAALENKLMSQVKGYLAAAAVVAYAKSLIDAADRMHDLSEQTNIAVEDLSRLEYAAAQSGASMEVLMKGARSLSRAMADAAGNGQMANVFRELNIAVTDTEGRLRPVNAVLLDLADRIKDAQGGTANLALAQKLLGKSGAELLPFLRQGSQGIKQLGKDLDTLGGTMSTAAADAADRFNDTLHTLKVTAGGLGRDILTFALPGLTALARILNSLTQAALFAIVGITKGIAGAAAASVQVMKGNFSLALQIIKEHYTEIGDMADAANARLKVIWSDTPAPKPLDDNDDLTQSLIKAAKGAKDVQTAGEKALETLQRMSAELDQQAATVGMTAGETMRYRMTLGDLSDEWLTAGAAADVFAHNIVRTTEALEQGEKVRAAIATMKDLATSMADQAATSGLAGVALMRYRLSVGDLAEALQLAGAEGKTYAEAILDAAQRLEEYAAATDAAAAKTQALKQASEAAAAAVQRQADQAAGIISNAIHAGYEAGIKGMLSSFSMALQQMAIEAVAADIAGRIFGTATSSTGGDMFGKIISGVAGWASGLFGGGRAKGGPTEPGKIYKVNENTPNSEWFMPDRAGTVIPNEGMGGGMVVNNNFAISAPSGTIDRRTQQQVAAAAGRGIGFATRRNG